MGCGKSYEAPTVPQYTLPSWAESLPPEIIDYIKQGVGQTLSQPAEYDIASQQLQSLLGQTPEQFAYPMADIQKALEAQQGLQYEQYQKQIRPTMAAQGQLDSTYYANMLSDFLKNQQSQSLSNTANLLTNQATQNFQLQQWLPQFKASVSQALQGVGGAKSGIEQYNMQYPYQTYIPALSNMFGQGMNLGNQQYQSAMNQYQAALNEYNQNVADASAKWQSLGMLGGPTVTAFAPNQFQGDVLAGNIDLLKTLLPFMTGGMGGGTSGGMDLSGLNSSSYNPSWANSRLGSQLYNQGGYSNLGGYSY
jgi:hypothetical protein